MKDSATILRSQADTLRKLSPEEFYAAVTALWDYEMDEKEPDGNAFAVMAVGMARPIIDKRVKKAEAGRKGGEANGSKPKQTEADGSKPEQAEANEPYKGKSIKVKDKRKEIKEVEEKTEKRFRPPTLEEVQAYIREQGYAVDANRFIDFYSSKGWMVGKNKMKDWKAAVRGWASRDRPIGSKFNNFQSSGTDWDDLAYQVMDSQ